MWFLQLLLSLQKMTKIKRFVTNTFTTIKSSWIRMNFKTSWIRDEKSPSTSRPLKSFKQLLGQVLQLNLGPMKRSSRSTEESDLSRLELRAIRASTIIKSIFLPIWPSSMPVDNTRERTTLEWGLLLSHLMKGPTIGEMTSQAWFHRLLTSKDRFRGFRSLRKSKDS